MSPSSSRYGDGLLRAVCVPRDQSPKVEVKSRHSLYIISYSEVPVLTKSRSRSRLRSGDQDEVVITEAASKCREFCVSLYIDIPTIDYYNDELRDNKLSRFNKRFKLHLLRESIFKSFTNGNAGFWDHLMENVRDGDVKKFRVSMSSSGSLRYVETVKFLIEACYDKLAEYVQSNRVDLKISLEVTPTSHKWFTTFLNKDVLDKNIIEFVDLEPNSKISESATTPFKEYYAQLNDKFAPSAQTKTKTFPEKIDSIVIVTNSTGVKALLTILSDRPLTRYIVQESIDALHENGLKRKENGMSIESSEDDTPLKRESSSLISFQNSLLTSNKDKSVRIRSRSLNQKSNRVHICARDGVALKRKLSTDSPSPSSTTLTRKLSNAADAENEEENNEEFDDEYDDDEEEEDNDDEDGLSFSVPSRLSRSTSPDAFSTQPSRPSRFRSLSLMNPERQGSFPLGATDDEVSSVDGSRIANIYIHDGEFDEGDPGTSRRNKRKVNKALLSRQNSSNGLIPPEFYSRISSPCTSASSSNSSLQNLNMAPGTFSKWLGPDSSATTTSSNSQAENFHPLFEKNLITKSFEERTNKSSMSLFSTLMGATADKNPLALNFRSNKLIPSDLQVMDEEDRLMSGYHNANNNYSAEETSEDDSRSTSTVVPEKLGFAGSRDRDIDKERRSPSEQPKLVDSLRNLHLNLKLYDDEEEKTQTNQTQEYKAKSEVTEKSAEKAKPKYKKAITLDLYGDDDLDNAGGWILGGNAR